MFKKIRFPIFKTLLNSNSALFKIFIIFGALAFILRIFFITKYHQELTINFSEITKIFLIGIFFDTLTYLYIIAIPAIYYFAITDKFFNKKSHQTFLKIIYFIFLNVIVFSACAEIIFFDEFDVRFNFIAVDYLIYTTEVIGNIVESYPLGWLLSTIFTISAIIFYLSRDKFLAIFTLKNSNLISRGKFLALILSLNFAQFFLFDSAQFDKYFENNYNKEVAYNGIYQLFSAYRNNQIDYEKFYLSENSSKTLSELRSIINKQEPYARFVDNNSIARFIPKKNSSPEKRYNVILVVMESFSADFMASFGNKNNLAPNIDFLAKKGLFFTNLKSTGTRTVRGLEAITLSVPPTPGNSIVRRPRNEHLFNLSSPFLERGYEAKFIYGGDGYFDNMNYFFANNGFEIIDRPKFNKNEISFSNVWGVADEDLFDKAIKEADKSFAQKRHFLQLIMTTSNHRPFTYPEGKIDIPSKSNRNGAVKYADYAIGQLVKKSQNKDWFQNTIFVFVADHCAGSAGNTDVPLWRYQIPAIFYAPNIIAPQIYAKNASQIDIASTLLDILNFSYISKFFGADLLRDNPTYTQRAFVSTYTDLGYLDESQKLYLLKLKKALKVYDVKFNKFGWQGSEETLTNNYSRQKLLEAISYYQQASESFKHGLMKLDKKTKNGE